MLLPYFSYYFHITGISLHKLLSIPLFTLISPPHTHIPVYDI